MKLTFNPPIKIESVPPSDSEIAERNFRLYPLTPPEWLRAANSRSLLNSRDVADALNLKSRKAIDRMLAIGRFPRPDHIVDGRRNYWKPSTIIDEIRRAAKKR